MIFYMYHTYQKKEYIFQIYLKLSAELSTFSDFHMHAFVLAYVVLSLCNLFLDLSDFILKIISNWNYICGVLGLTIFP